MIQAIPTTPATNIAIPQLNSGTTIAQAAPSQIDKTKVFSRKQSPNQVSIANWIGRVPLSSSKHNHQLAPNSIAQSELPGDSTPPSPSIRDTGSGYPARIPANYFGPALSFGNGATAFGVVSRFPFGDKYSIRPSAVFGSKGTTIRVPVTYDFTLSEKEPFERNPLVTFNVGGGVQFASGGGSVQGDKFSLLGTFGVDVNLFEGVALVAGYNTDFSSNNAVNVGLGFEF